MRRLSRKGIWSVVAFTAALITLAGIGLSRAGESANEQKPAEQAFKNIQTLKGLPDSQLIGVMAYMQASLGAKDCEYCHVRSGEFNWEWEKDDKPKKQAARRMVQMVLDINKASFEGRPEVTCYTCHQGHERPVAIPSLPLAMTSANSAPPRPAGPMPTSDQLLDKYVQAVGGKPAAGKFNSIVLKGTQVGANGTAAPVEIYRKAPGKILSTITTPQMGSFSLGFDGTNGWTQARNGTRDMSAPELAQVKELAGIYDPIKIPEPFPRMRLVAKEKIGEHDAWILRAPGPDNTTLRLYFDAETGLLVRKVILTPSVIGTIPEQFDFEDYRDADGAKLPFTIRLSSVNPRMSWDQKFESVRHDLPVEDSKFSKPAPSEK